MNPKSGVTQIDEIEKNKWKKKKQNRTLMRDQVDILEICKSRKLDNPLFIDLNIWLEQRSAYISFDTPCMNT